MTGSDTIVTHNGRIYEKPADTEDAVRLNINSIQLNISRSRHIYPVCMKQLHVKLVAGSSQRWAGQHTGCSVGSAWWSETPTDRFELVNQVCITFLKKKRKSIFISLFSGPFSLSDFVRPYFFPFLSAFSSSQVERTSFFEGTDVEMATLSEEVVRTHNIWQLYAIIWDQNLLRIINQSTSRWSGFLVLNLNELYI